MIEIYSDIKKEQYNLFIKFMLENCDSFTFFLPNFNKNVVTVDNKFYFPNDEIGAIKYSGDCMDFQTYKKTVADRVELISNNIIKKTNDVKYCGDIYTYDCEIYVVKINEFLDKKFFKADSLFDWKYPMLPEDICFYKDGKCLMRSIAHEEMCSIYNTEFDDIESKALPFLDNIGLDYWVDSYEIGPDLLI